MHDIFLFQINTLGYIYNNYSDGWQLYTIIMHDNFVFLI